MFQVASNCHKCPSMLAAEVRVENSESMVGSNASAKVLPFSQEPTERLATERDYQNALDFHRQETLLNAANKAPSSELAVESKLNSDPANVLKALQPNHSNGSIFFEQRRDDRSILTSTLVHPFAKLVMVFLIAMHVFAQTPGVGAGLSVQAISAFVIASEDGVVNKAGGLSIPT